MGAEDAPARVLVVGGSPEPSSAELIRSLAERAERVIAVDRGLDRALAAGAVPDLFCGDCDTVSDASLARLSELEAAGTCAVDRYDPHKDYTDLTLAIRAVDRMWPGAPCTFTCFGGGRPDHLLAVLGSLMRAPFPVELAEDGLRARILHAGDSWEIEGHAGDQFSFISIGGGSVVSEAGMEWEIDHVPCEALSDLGVSNIIRAARAAVSCHEGCIVAYLFK